MSSLIWYEFPMIRHLSICNNSPTDLHVFTFYFLYIPILQMFTKNIITIITFKTALFDNSYVKKVRFSINKEDYLFNIQDPFYLVFKIPRWSYLLVFHSSLATACTWETQLVCQCYFILFYSSLSNWHFFPLNLAHWNFLTNSPNLLLFGILS